MHPLLKSLAVKLKCPPRRLAAFFSVVEVNGELYMVDHRFAAMMESGELPFEEASESES